VLVDWWSVLSVDWWSLWQRVGATEYQSRNVHSSVSWTHLVLVLGLVAVLGWWSVMPGISHGMLTLLCAVLGWWCCP
jgi:hypothetical protein